MQSAMKPCVLSAQRPIVGGLIGGGAFAACDRSRDQDGEQDTSPVVGRTHTAADVSSRCTLRTPEFASDNWVYGIALFAQCARSFAFARDSSATTRQGPQSQMWSASHAHCCTCANARHSRWWAVEDLRQWRRGGWSIGGSGSWCQGDFSIASCACRAHN